MPATLPAEAWPGAYLFMSQRTRRAAIEARGWTLSRTAIVPYGIDHRDFPVADGPVPERPWRWRLLFVGRVEPRKGIAAAVRALTHLPLEATLEVLGPIDPNYRSELDDLIDSLHVADRVHFATVPRAGAATALPRRRRVHLPL